MTYVISNNSNIYNVQAQKASSISSQTGTTSYQDLDTSDITYTCDSSASKVVYEYTVNFVRTSTFGVGSAKLLEYNTTTNSWEDFSNSTYASFGLATSSGYSRNNYTFKFVLDSWTGDKQLKMQWKMATGGLKAHHSDYVILINNISNSSYLIKPFLVVYSIK